MKAAIATWNRILRNLAFVLVLAAMQGRTAESPTVFLSQTWQTEDGLPHNTINGIIQTPDGYLWLATREGLARFDGVQFVNVDASQLPDTKSHAFASLSQSRDGTLWAVTEDGQVRCFKSGKPIPCPLPADIAHRQVTRIFESRNGALWIGTQGDGVLCFDKGRISHWTTTNGLARAPIQSICEDINGTIWIGTGAGLGRLKDGEITLLTTKEGLLHNSVRAVYPDRNGNIWLGSAAAPYGLTGLKDGRFQHFTIKEGLAGNQVTSVLEDREGAIWVGTFNGLNRIIGTEVLTETHADGSSYDRVNCLLEDSEGDIWVGTRDGLTRLKPRVITVVTRQQGLTYNLASSIMETRAGALWVGFWGGGVNRIKEGKILPYTTREGLSSDFVLTIYQDHNTEMWFGMDYNGGMTLMETNGGFVHYRELEGLKDQGIKAIEEGPDQRLWVGTRTALLTLKDGEFQRFTAKDGLPSDTIETIQAGRDERMWFGTAGGLAVWQDGKFKAFTTKDGLSCNAITALLEDAEGTLWIATRGGGLNCFRAGKFFSCTTTNGLFSDEIAGLVEDDRGFLWMSCLNGIFRASKAELFQLFDRKKQSVFCVPFGKADGMVTVECRGSGKTAACRSHDGLLWFPTGKGIVAVDPRRVHVNDNPPPVYLEDLLVNGHPADVSRPFNEVSRRQELVFRFTAICFSAPEKVRFKYRLEGLEDDWVDAGNRREARYAYLPPGQYRFRVIAANGEGVWNLKGAEIPLLLRAPFWQTSWFLSLAGLVLAGAIAGTARYVSVRRLHARLREVEREHALEKERSRIAQDMHDELGVRLTEIMILSDFTQQGASVPPAVQGRLEKICNAAREVVRNLDAIVWAVNPENDTLDRLAGYLQEYAQQRLEAAGRRCKFDFPMRVPDCAVASDTRHHLFSVVKETLHNVVKHAGATEVRMKFAMEGTTLVIDIADNGKGFSPEEVSAFGNGLKNMRKRMAAVEGTFNLRSEQGRGTTVEIRIPLPALPLEHQQP